MKNRLKTKEELLKSFKKSNKIRRQVMANRAGFDSPREYQTHLENQISKEVEEILTIHNVHLIDSSGSMCWQNSPTKFDNVVVGVNEELKALRKDKQGVNYIQTIVNFSGMNSYKIEFNRCPLEEISKFNCVPFMGGTALYKSIVILLGSLQVNKGEKVLVKIFTDGKDEHSRSFREDASKAILDAKNRGITVTFVGTEKDVQRSIKKLNIDASNTLVHDNTPEAVLDTFGVTTSSTINYVSRAIKGENVLKGFYKKQGTL